MFTALKFFFNNLSKYQVSFFGIFLALHILSNIWHLDAEKQLAKNIPKILSNSNDDEFITQLTTILLLNVGYLILYAITMFIIETIGKIAIRNAINDISRKLLNIDLSKISKKQYEHNVTSIIHHSENISSAIHNLFIEFPKKFVACYHFLIVLKELSFEIMLYCIAANVLFVLITIGISIVRKYLFSNIVEGNIKFSLICSDISNSIQTYKIDGRMKEYERKINNISQTICYNSSIDSLMITSNEVITSFSSQFMIGLISYMCRPLVLSNSIAVEDLMYGVRSSSKFIEKLIGVFEYIGDIMRQYKSSNFFISIKVNTILEKCNQPEDIKFIIIGCKTRHDYQNNKYSITDSKGHCFRIIGPNGIGKTTLLHKFLGVSYKGAKSNGYVNAFNDIDKYLSPTSYRQSLSFVQQNIPLTYDTVKEYISAVSKSNINVYQLLRETLYYFNVNINTMDRINKFVENLGPEKSMRELSGGQAKFIQILTAIIKLYKQHGLLLILDEPTNNLDIEKVNDVKELFLSCISKNIIIIMITHDERIILNNIMNIELSSLDNRI